MFLYYTEERRTYSSCKPATGGEERRGEERREERGRGQEPQGSMHVGTEREVKQLIYREKWMYLSDLGPGAAVTFAHYCV
jgi:hypothetical protein